MSAVEFVDQLPARVNQEKGPQKFDDVREELRRAPGRWAVLPSLANGKDHARKAANLMRRSSTWDEFDVECRNRTIYVRYVGGAS